MALLQQIIVALATFIPLPTTWTTHVEKQICEMKLTANLKKIERLRSIYDDPAFGPSAGTIMNYVIDHKRELSEPEKIALVKKAISRDPDAHLGISLTGITDQKALAEIYLVAVTKKYETGKTYDGIVSFRHYGITDQSILVPLIKRFAELSPKLTAAEFNHFGIKDEIDRITIAKQIMEKSTETAKFIQLFDIQNQKALVEIAKIVARKNIYDLSQNIEKFKIKDETDRIRIAQEASDHRYGIASSISRFHIHDQLALIEIAKQNVTIDANGLCAHIGNYGIQDQKVLNELAIEAYTRAYRADIDYIRNFKITDTEIYFQIAQIVALKSPMYALQELRKFGLSFEKIPKILAVIFSNLQTNEMDEQNEVYRVEIYKSFALNYDDKLLLPYLGRDKALLRAFGQYDRITFNATQPLPLLEHLLAKYDHQHFINTIKDSSQHAEVQIRLFMQVWNVLYSKNEELIKRLRSNPHSSHVIESGLGLPEKSLKAWSKLSNDRKNIFYELALELIQIRPDIFSQSPEIASLLSQKDSFYILNFIRDLLLLSPSSYPQMNALFKQYSNNGPELVTQLKNLYANEIKNLFQDPTLEFSYSDYLKLKMKWGNVEPILTLLSRFNGTSGWKNEIPYLTRIFQAVLRDDFVRLKFEKGFSSSDQDLLDKQIGYLSHKEVQNWQQIRNKVKVVELSELVTTEDPRKRFTDGIKDNLIPHLKAIIPAETVGPFESKLSYEFPAGTNPIEELKILRKNWELNEIIKHLIIFISENDVRRIEFALKFLKSNIRDLTESDTLQRQIQIDLKDLQQFYQIDKQREHGRAIIFTTVLNDAKSLLTVGDLVEASSCQNYKTGGFIQTLLGYVLDAHVQAVLSYSIARGDFCSDRDYTSALHAVELDTNSISFDPYTQTFSIRTAEKTINTLTIKKAYRRQILKLGKTTSGRPGVRLERAYFQNHAAQALMQQQTQNILTDLETELKVGEGAIEIAKSRNIGGVYSDASGGVQCDAYEIK